MSKQLNVRGEAAQALETWSTKTWPVGTRMHVPDGRVFRLAQATATAIAVGRAVQANQPDMRVRNKGVAVRTDPNPSVVTLTGVNTPSDQSAVQANDYAEGLLYVISGGGAGYVYRIESNTKADSLTNTLKVIIEAGSVTGLAQTTTRITLLKNRFRDVALSDAPPSAAVIGVSSVAVAASAYFWLQTHGAAAVLQEGELAVNLPVAASKTTSGAVRLATVTVPNTFSGIRNDTGGLAVVPTIQPADARAERLAPVSGVGVVPDLPLGYVLDPGYDGAHALVHLSIEGG